MNASIEIVKKFWSLFSEARFGDAKCLMHPNILVAWPNTREVFRGRDKFVAVNAAYPGRWTMSIEKLLSENDTVVSVVRVESFDQTQSFYATSFFIITDGLIREITEYWSDNGEPPEWRIQNKLSQRY